MTTLTVLGNFSGRNAGDNAILGNLLADFSSAMPDAEFKIPTFNPQFVKKHYGHYNIKPMGLKPWNGALKILGLPTLRAMLECDAILITDNILFDRSFFNPLFNYLSTIALIAPLCKRRGIPLIPYNASLGPFRRSIGHRAMQKVMDAAPFSIVRDAISVEALDNNGIRHGPVFQGADCAINTQLPTNEIIDAIAAREGLFRNPNGTISFNINPYIDSWLGLNGRPALERKDFVRMMAETMDTVIDRLDVDILFTTTQIMDCDIVRETHGLLRHRDRVKIVGNRTLTYQELTGLLSRCGLHVGMRTHSKILAAAAHTPMITINAYPKSVGFVKTVGMGDWVVNLNELPSGRLTDLVLGAWERRRELKSALIPRVAVEQRKALEGVKRVTDYLASREVAQSHPVAAH